MSSVAPKQATYADLAAVPADRVAQILGGELIVLPRPASPHVRITSELGIELGPPFRRGRGGPGGWILLDEPELHLDNDILVPDMAGWRLERAPDLTTAFISTTPDWICEVLSPSTRRIDRMRKMPIYQRAGVGHVWLIEPDGQTVEVFRRDVESWILVGTFGGEAPARIQPFDAIELDLSLILGPVLDVND
jgi:Uma2 family endonuclease